MPLRREGARAGHCPVVRLRSLALVCALALLAIPASASAAVNVTAFSVTPSTTQAGGHPT